MARKTLRWYQREAVDAVISALQAARNTHPIAAIVTGGGKSLIAADLCEHLIALYPAARVMILAPSQELVMQNTEEARQYLSATLVSGVGIYCSSLGRKDRQRKITFGTPQSVWRQVRRFGPIDFCIVDEAHGFRLELKSIRKLVDGMREINPHVRVIGLTATPFFMKGVKVVPLAQGGLFTAKVYDLTTGRNFNRLVREGYISPIVAPTIRFPQIDLDGVKTSGEDFDETQLAAAAMKITDEVVAVGLQELDNPDDYRSHPMWFCVNVAHAKMVRGCLARRGEAVTLIYGDLEKGERTEGIREFQDKETRHIVSVGTLTTGFNAPHVDAIVIVRATRSQILFRQMVGRGFRMYPGKTDCKVLDAGGNFARLGPINADLEQGDSRAGLWECSAQQMEAPGNAPQRERSGIRFPAPSPEIEERDLRIVLNLEGFNPDEPGCGYLNDPEHMTCRNCGRPRQGFITQSRKPDLKDPNAGIGDSYDMHDEDSIILRDDLCAETKSFPVHHTEVRAHGDSVLVFEYHTDAGPYTLRLDFDRKTAENRFFAQARKYFEVATGRKLPNEPHRVLLQRDAIPHPVELTLTKAADGIVWLTQLQFIRDGQMQAFRYDPAY
ncbi:DEAD/DEAH box helicase family protein [Xanthomonas euvesicatoria]|nr:DNA helicase [Xanthomonas phage MYK3]